MLGSGTDTYDPVCELPKGHDGPCKSSAAVDQHRLPERVAAPAVVANPATGIVVELAGPTDQLAAAIDECRDMEEALRAYKRTLADEILRRMDHEGTWTARVGRYKVEGDGPRADTYDGERLWKALEPLVSGGSIAGAARLKAVEPETVYKVKKAGVNALLKLGPEVVEAVRSAAEQNLKPRAVRVKPERS